MSERRTVQAYVLVDASVPGEEERQLREALVGLGVTPDVRTMPTRRGAEQLQWLVLVALPLQAFLSGTGGKIAEDAHEALKRAVRTVLRRKRSAAEPPSVLVFQDPATGLQLILGADLSDDGYRQLFDLDLSQFRLGPVHYDHRQQRWRSELDEAIGDTRGEGER